MKKVKYVMIVLLSFIFTGCSNGSSEQQEIMQRFASIEDIRGRIEQGEIYFDYWENVKEVRDISNLIEPLIEIDKKYYTKEEFENEPMLVIHLAKNEIYARHGYIFVNEDLDTY